MSYSNVPQVTLQVAVLMQIEEFAKNKIPFTAHMVTSALRDKCNNGLLEIPEVEDKTGNDTYRFPINHPEVKSIVRNLIKNGTAKSVYDFSEDFNGMYFTYTAIPKVTYTGPVIKNPSVVPISTTPVSAVTGCGSIIINRIDQYLKNCRSRNFRPNLKQVQSAIKRGNKSTGTTWGEIADVITNDLGYTLSNGCTIKTIQVIL